MQIQIDPTRLQSEIEMLATISEAEPPAVTRIVYSDVDRRARSWFIGLCEAAGLHSRIDAIGDIFVRLEGAEPDLPAIGTGSHIDAIPFAGSYDGTVGVLGGLEAIRAIKESGLHLRRSIELLLFTAEEPTRFGIGCFGSRLLTGVLDSTADDNLRDSEGLTLAQLRQQAGYIGSLESVRLPRDYYAAFVELHIEQGPLLERERVSIGIVTNIAAPAGLRISIEGEGGHAGAVLMPDRRDAFCAAAEIVLAVEKSARGTGAIDTCGTVGKCQIHPGAVNSIPSKVLLEVDIRDTDEQRRNRVLEEVKDACARIASARGVIIRLELVNADSPAHSSAGIIDAIVEATEALGLSYKKMVSRAYHDSLFMARIAPMSMIFIPCRGGVSHRPDEFAAPEDIANGTRVLAHTLAHLASQ
ncbi:M20 family metallo-hydrolase [Edaphobacter modestus]|uniref:N-carbamoyl-L-amino-acid hydrolase n=1 Tax=Edaphobacter modestus TaxID=388466 RepID=A0A4Q7YQH5_9BACT|nr:M20 family metallo-hydrolase [Edaphobacter modestus]RZU39005.1 N-carbamoyl-L-amino-acid hydrolase [Edaphobacter modestus]